MRKECEEEASLPASLSKNVRSVGQVRHIEANSCKIKRESVGLITPLRTFPHD